MAGSKATRNNTPTPVYQLKDFDVKAPDVFYIEQLSTHVLKHKFISRPHKHDFYLLLYVISGKGNHDIDFNSYPIKSNTFYFMTPGQVHRLNASGKLKGFIIFFTKDFYEGKQNSGSLASLPFFQSHSANGMLSAKRDKTMDMIISNIHKEYSQKQIMGDEILRAYLELLLILLSRQYSNQNLGKKNIHSSRLRELTEMIDEKFLETREPRQFADLLNVSASYLNTICKTHLGKTLSQLIHDRVVLEAKRLFSYSDLSTKQVSGKLNFKDNSYFIRFFKRETGLTPHEFKESIIRPI
jgi:AraC family transcriptional activator of pobA